ncbi:MAG: 4Fe-4S binding protein, partial [Pseudomonas formosensis]|nr:4Fe-4S binding protein [Halopseudomonas formosensis]
MNASRTATGPSRWLLCLVLMLSFFLTATASAEQALIEERISQFFPQVTAISEPEGEYGIRTLADGVGTVYGYAFESINVLNIPAYSGKPINMLILLDTEGVIQDAYVLEHHEPILLIGIPEQRLHDFNALYHGIRADQRVVVGRSKDPDAVTVDAVAGATVTVMVVNEIVMRAAQEVGAALGLVKSNTLARSRPATVLEEVYRPASWTELIGDGSIRRLLLSNAEVNQAFVGTAAEQVDQVPADQLEETFIDLHVAYLNPPTVGRNLLGDNQYRFLMQDLKPGEHAFAVLSNGRYSYKGSGFVRGGIYDRFQIRQFGNIHSFRDLDHQRLYDLMADGAPRFQELGVFILREDALFDPGTPWTLELLVRRQTGPVDSTFVTFELPYQTPEDYIQRPEPTPEELRAIEEANRPMWVNIWYQKSFQVGVILVALLLLTIILFFQDSFARHPTFLRWLRHGYLTFTVVFIGWYALGQLSVVNVLTFVHALVTEFRWELFLSDPVIFILWTFTAASILLWGRGVFCGWLCPFGALQELINEVARKLRIPQYELPFAVHERLWAIKYIILLVLFGISLESMMLAEKAAEVEPFKTAIMLKFDRQWWFVLYAVILLVV